MVNQLIEGVGVALFGRIDRQGYNLRGPECVRCARRPSDQPYVRGRVRGTRYTASGYLAQVRQPFWPKLRSSGQRPDAPRIPRF